MKIEELNMYKQYVSNPREFRDTKSYIIMNCTFSKVEIAEFSFSVGTIGVWIDWKESSNDGCLPLFTKCFMKLLDV